MTIDDIIDRIKRIRSEKARAATYWAKTKRKIRPSERAMTVSSIDMDIQALDRVIIKLLNEQASLGVHHDL